MWLHLTNDYTSEKACPSSAVHLPLASCENTEIGSRWKQYIVNETGQCVWSSGSAEYYHRWIVATVGYLLAKIEER